MEPRELSRFQLDALLSGGTGVVSRMQWFAYAPHLPAPVEIDPDDVILLGQVSPLDWVEAATFQASHGEARTACLLDAGLLVADALADVRGWTTHRDSDERFRAQHWHGLSAIHHMATRWEGVDAVREGEEQGLDTSAALRDRHGPPPPVLHDAGDGSRRIALPRAEPGAFDALLEARASCRNFDTGRLLPMAQFARLLDRVFGARAVVPAADDFEVLKKSSPSGGALHPIEAYLLVQRVEGVAPGLYHYRPGGHALDPLPWSGTPEALRDLARRATAGQDWFAEAHVLVVLAPRFARNFWKYRNHAKAYRVTVLDAGHLSQTMFLAATEQALGAFITAAINEVDIEEAFGLRGYVDGPLAVCGFGIRADAMRTGEFDPNRKVWKAPIARPGPTA